MTTDRQTRIFNDGLGRCLVPPGGVATVGQWLVSSTLGATLPRSAVDSDRAALEALYRATGGREWKIQTNWLSSRPLGDWHGVTTNSLGRVTFLDLESNRLSGSIPPELGDLTNLVGLSLGWNDPTGSMPPDLGNLTHLWSPWLNENSLSGPIPPELGNLSNLTMADSIERSIERSDASGGALNHAGLGFARMGGCLNPAPSLSALATPRRESNHKKRWNCRTRAESEPDAC